jgi:hypothetical protein
MRPSKSVMPPEDVSAGLRMTIVVLAFRHLFFFFFAQVLPTYPRSYFVNSTGLHYEPTRRISPKRSLLVDAMTKGLP